MKKILSLIALFSLFLTGCIKNKEIHLEETVVELDAATYNAKVSGQRFPLLVRMPNFGSQVVNANSLGTTPDPLINRTIGTVRLRVNLVGPQRSTDTQVRFETFTKPETVTAVSIPTSRTASTTSSVSLADAVAGTHYTALSGTVTIPANSSFGYINIPILNTGASAANARFLGVRLIYGGDVPPNTNYNEVAIAIDQR